jgi:hypothetical protein
MCGHVSAWGHMSAWGHVRACGHMSACDMSLCSPTERKNKIEKSCAFFVNWADLINMLKRYNSYAASVETCTYHNTNEKLFAL